MLLGMYLHGSLVTGDFAADRSDLDLLAVLDIDPHENLLAVLASLHADLDPHRSDACRVAGSSALMTGRYWPRSCTSCRLAAPGGTCPRRRSASAVTAHRRFAEWTVAGLWERLHHAFLNQLGEAAAIAWSRAVVDSISVRAERGAI